MEDVERQEVIAVLKKVLFKLSEITSMMKKGEFIIAYEKLGGVQKNLDALGAQLQQTKSDTTQGG